MFFQKSRTTDSLYVRALTWAYENDSQGFRRSEMEDALNLSDEERRRLDFLFFQGTNDNPPLIQRAGARDEIDYFALTRTGIAAAIDYLDLKEAREGSALATKIAIASIIIGILIGIGQILVAIY